MLKAINDLAEDCDMDCQRRGTQLTVVAILMSTAYGIIAVNALLMLAGTWVVYARVISIFCSMAACFI